jgi:hypothetical protein
MTTAIRAELAKVANRRILGAGMLVALAFAVVATVSVFLAAGTGPSDGRTATLGSLAGAGGGTEAFAIGASFVGLLVLVVFAINFTGEFSRGTMRTLLMREPRRLTLLAGKMTALLAVAAAIALTAAALTWIASLAIAPSQGVSTSDWFTWDAVSENIENVGSGLLAIGGWAALGAALGVVLRSAPIALAVGVAWAGPFEHITQNAWSGAGSWFPGLLLESVAAGGTPDASLSRALALDLVYVAAGVALAAIAFRRRDVAG